MTEDLKHKSLTDAWAAFPHPDEPDALDIVKARAATAVSIDCQSAAELKTKLGRQNQAGHWSDADLSKIAADAWAAEADKQNKEDADERARIAGIRKRRDDSIEHAAIVKKIMETLFVGQRQGYYIADEGTTDRAQAKALASTFADDPKRCKIAFWLRKKGLPGRRASVSKRLKGGRFEGCSSWAFVYSEPKVSNAAGHMIQVMRKKFESGDQTEHEALEDFVQFARFNGFSTDAARDVWQAFEWWRYLRLCDLHRSELNQRGIFGPADDDAFEAEAESWDR